MFSHSDSERMQRTSYQSMNVSLALAENFGRRLEMGPFFCLDEMVSFAWRSVAVADCRVACWSAWKPCPKSWSILVFCSI